MYLKMQCKPLLRYIYNLHDLSKHPVATKGGKCNNMQQYTEKMTN